MGEAEAEYRRALRLAEQAGRGDLRCRALEWAARLHIRQGRYDRAIEVLEVAQRSSGQVGDHLGETIALGTLGTVMRSSVRLKEAVAAFSEARAIAERIGNRHELTRLGLEQLQLSLARGDLAGAQRNGRESLALYESLGETLRCSIVVRQLAEVAALHDDFDEAEDLYRQAVDLLGERPNHVALAETLASRADARADAGRLDEALRDLVDARTHAEIAGSQWLADGMAVQGNDIRERHAAQSLLGRYRSPRLRRAFSPAGRVASQATYCRRLRSCSRTYAAIRCSPSG